MNRPAGETSVIRTGPTRCRNSDSVRADVVPARRRSAPRRRTRGCRRRPPFPAAPRRRPPARSLPPPVVHAHGQRHRGRDARTGRVPDPSGAGESANSLRTCSSGSRQQAQMTRTMTLSAIRRTSKAGEVSRVPSGSAATTSSAPADAGAEPNVGCARHRPRPSTARKPADLPVVATVIGDHQEADDGGERGETAANPTW